MDYRENVNENAERNISNEVVKAAKKLFSNIGFRLLIGTVIVYGVCYGLQYLLLSIMSAVNPGFIELVTTDYTANLVFSMGIQYAFAMPLLALVLAVKLPGKAPEKRKIGFGWWLVFFIISYSLMYSSNLIGTGINSLISSISGNTISTYAVQTMIQNANIWVVTICTVIFAPLVEELIFRKILIDRCGRYGEAASALLSGLAFGLFHGNLTQGIYAFCLGYFLALVYSKTGKIQATIGIHMVVNFMGSFIPMTLLKFIDLDALDALDPNNTESVIEFMSTYGIGFMILSLYGMLIMALVIAGIVLLIVNRRKFMPQPGEVSLPRHSTFKTVVGNPGMLVFIIASIGYIVYTFIEGLRV